jgi:hypothetical protein
MFGTEDTLSELGTGFVVGDFDQIVFVANSSSTLYLFRLIWGTPTQTMAEAIAAGQYSETPFIRANTDTVRQVRVLPTPLIGINDKIWAQCQNASDNATLDFVVGVHAYTF